MSLELWFGEDSKVSVKENIVGKFSICDELSIINVTALMKNNFGFMKIYVLWIKYVWVIETFRDFDGPLVIEDFVFELFWKNLRMEYGRGLSLKLVYIV